MKVSYITLRGSYRSWGTLSIGQNRSTEMIPTASAILGLAARCIGLNENNPNHITSWYNSFWVVSCTAIRFINTINFLEYSPNILSDFQTAQGEFAMNGQNKRSISYKEYLTDSIDVAAIISKTARSSDWLDQLQTSFEQPCATPFLGRKCNLLSAPPTNIGDRTIFASTIDEIAETLSNRICHERIGDLKISKILLRLPKDLYGGNPNISNKWQFIGEKRIEDQRNSHLRFFSSRNVVDFITEI